MAKMTLDQLRKLREETKGEMTRRETEGKEIQVIVGMGTCGIAAGAKESFDAIVKAVDEFKIGANVVIRQTGCMGLCHVEPTVEVIVPGMPATIYGRVDAAVAADAGDNGDRSDEIGVSQRVMRCGFPLAFQANTVLFQTMRWM